MIPYQKLLRRMNLNFYTTFSSISTMTTLPPKKRVRELKATDSPLSGFGILKRLLLKPAEMSASPLEKSRVAQHALTFAQLIKAKKRFAKPLDSAYADLISRLEQFVHEHIQESGEVEGILLKIKSILDSPLSLQSQFIQISLIYFYLERDCCLPETTSFIKFRFDELKEEAGNLHAEAFPPLHSGIQTYLLRALCNMALFADGQINKGGTAAAIVLLNSELASYFKDDHMLHIRSIFKKLMSDADFQKLIEDPVDSIDPTVETLIRIDCKIPIDAPITRQHVRQFCLFGLLHDLRQFFLPNCYAVATLSYGLRSSPERLLSLYRELIVEGSFEIVSEIKIPVTRLAIDRLLYDPDLELRVDFSRFSRTSIFQSIIRVVKASGNPMMAESTPTIREILKAAAELSSLGIEEAYVTSLLTFSSYKRNFLQEMVLAQMEFSETNGTHVLTRLDHAPRAVKGQFIEFMQREIYSRIEKTFPDYLAKESVSEFFYKFTEEMEKCFWLQDCPKPVKVIDDELIVTHQNGTVMRIRFDKDSASILNFFSQHRRLLYIKDSKIVYIEHLDVLRTVIREIIQGVLKQSSTYDPDQWLFGLHVLGLVLSGHLRESVANFLESANKSKAPLTALHYSNSGFIGFMQDGGSASNFPFKTLGFTPASMSFSSIEPADNFLQLFRYLHAYEGKDEFTSPHKWMICCSENHAFLIQPAAFSGLWNTSPPDSALQLLGWKRMEHLLEKEMTIKQMSCVLQQVIDNPSGVLSHLNQRYLTARQFRYFFQSCFSANPEIWQKFDLALYNHLMLIPVSAFLINTILPPAIDLQKLMSLNLKVQQECARLSRSEMFPIELAHVLRGILFEHGLPYSIAELERRICFHYGLPIPWVIGDLNWGNYKEAPQHHLLVMRIVMDKLLFFSRGEANESIVQSDLYSSFRRLVVYK